MTDDFAKLAWAAGILDGESHFGAHHRKAERMVNITLNVTQCHNDDTKPPQMLTRLKEIFGFGNIYYCGRKPSKRSPESHQWEYRAWTYDQVHTVLRAVWPYLGRVKRRQAVKALRSYRADRRRPASI